MLRAEAITKTVYAGAYGEEFHTETDALRSLAKARLVKIILGDQSCDFNANEAADDVLSHGGEILAILEQLRTAGAI